MESLKIITDGTDDDGVYYIEIALKFKMRSTPFYLTLSADLTVKEVIQEFIRITSTLVSNSELGE